MHLNAIKGGPLKYSAIPSSSHHLNSNSLSSQIQGPLAQRRQGTGQKILDNTKTVKSSHGGQQKSTGYEGQSLGRAAGYRDDLIVSRPSGIPKPTSLAGGAINNNYPTLTNPSYNSV